MNLHVSLIDGNVARVLSRVLAYDGEVNGAQGQRQLKVLADSLLPKGGAGVFNESVMELGALCCLPRRPVCR